jgi:hypothetical protein
MLNDTIHTVNPSASTLAISARNIDTDTATGSGASDHMSQQATDLQATDTPRSPTPPLPDLPPPPLELDVDLIDKTPSIPSVIIESEPPPMMRLDSMQLQFEEKPLPLRKSFLFDTDESAFDSSDSTEPPINLPPSTPPPPLPALAASKPKFDAMSAAEATALATKVGYLFKQGALGMSRCNTHIAVLLALLLVCFLVVAREGDWI